MLSRVSVESNTCLLYNDLPELLSAVRQVVALAPEGERSLLVVSKPDAEALREALAGNGAGDVEGSLLASGRLCIATLREFSGDGGWSFEQSLQQALLQAQSAGFEKLRLLEQMSWLLEAPTPRERLQGCAVRLARLAQHGVAFFPLYDRSRFPADLLLEMIPVHCQIMVAGTLCRNRCHLPIEELLRRQRSELELERLLQETLSNEQELRRLRSHNSMLEAVIGTTDSVFVKDRHGRILLINEAGAAFLGRPVQDIIGRSVTELFPPDSAARILAADRKVMELDESLTDERVLTTPSGDRTVLSILAPYRDDHGNVIGTCGIGRDITARKAIEEALRVSDERFVEMQANTRHVLYRRDAATDSYDYISPFIEELLGYPYHEILQYGWEELQSLIHPDDLGKVLDLFKDAVLSDGDRCASANLEYRMRKKSGEYCWLSDWVTAYYDAEGGIERLVGSVYDITAAKRAQELLQENEERYRRLVELSPEAIFINVAGRFSFINAAGAALFGASDPAELYGRRVLDFVHPDFLEIVRRRAANVIEEGQNNPWLEELYLRLDGSSVPVEVAASPFNFQGEKAIQVIARDISERKRMHTDMLRAQKLESLGVLAGGIAHDFNNLLTGVFGNLSLAQLHLEPGHPAAPFIEACEKSIRPTTDLTRQLLTFARGGAPAKKLIDTAAAIREAALFTLRGAEVRSVIELPDDLWCMEADGEQLNQVLHNFLFNAAQAMPGGGAVRVAAANETLLAGNRRQLPEGSYVRIDIEDSGCGIPPENLAKIFDPYFTTKPQGTGLGLASVYSIVKRHGGVVEVSSTVGVGSLFSVFLPASPGELPEGEPPKQAAHSSSVSGRILVMDDEEVIREVITGMLVFLGYQVESCADGRRAVELVRQSRCGRHPFAAVILDLTVAGGMGGKEAAGLIREIDPGTPLIVSSGYSNDPVLADFREYGFSGVIAKPFDAEQLAAELKRLLR